MFSQDFLPPGFDMTEFPQEKRIIRSIPGPEVKGSRLDLWLASRFTYRSRSEWQQAVRRGEIILNGAKTRSARILNGSEVIEFHFPDLPEPPVRSDYSLLAEHELFLAVNKPGNLPVHPSGCFFNHTLLMLLRQKYGELYPVNRLDRETSGVVLFGRTPDAAARLSACLASRSVQKKYTVYVHGCFPYDSFRAKGWLSPDTASIVRKKRRFTPEKPDTPDCEDCDTELFLEKSSNSISRLGCLLHTGRLHQIRATLFSLGFPVVGDKLYGLDDHIFDRFSDERMTDDDRCTLIIERQALHASRLKMTSPFDGKEMIFDAGLPEEFSVLEKQFSLV